MSALGDLVGIPWRSSGRDENGVDCLGAVLLALRVRGVPAFDPWAAIRASYRAGQRDFSGVMIDIGWERLESHRALQDDDVLIAPAELSPALHVLLVCEDARRVLHCTEATGVVISPIEGVDLSRAWRHDSR